jgi:hypothetical protein
MKLKKKLKLNIFTIIYFLFFLFFAIPFFVHKWASNLALQLHFCNHLVCFLYSLIWLILAFVSIIMWKKIKRQNKKKKKKSIKILIIIAIIVLVVGIIFMNITYCNTENKIHFLGFKEAITGLFTSTSSNLGEDCTSGVDCPGDVVEVPIPPCIDTDTGRDYITPGMILSGANIPDVCMGTDILRERYCFDTLTYTSEDVSCSEYNADYVCEAGECVLGEVIDDDGEGGDEIVSETNCGDGIDNDEDGDIDCADSDCNIPFEDGGCGDFDYSCQHLSPYPECGGTCPTGEECIVYYAGDGTLDGGWCECMPEEETPCGGSGGCAGWCLEGDICIWDSAGCFCEFDFGCLETDSGIDPTHGGVTTHFPAQFIDQCIFKTDRLIEYSCGDGIENDEIDCEELGLICIDDIQDGSYCGEGVL